MRGYLRSIASSVRNFMIQGGQATPYAPCIPSITDLKAREAFLVEEVREMQMAIYNIEKAYEAGDASEVEQNTALLQEYADALLDVVYVAVGSLANAGINPEVQEALMQQVVRANNNKFFNLGTKEGAIETMTEELVRQYPDYKVEHTYDELGNTYAVLRDKTNGKIKKPDGWTDPKGRMIEILEKAIALGEMNYSAGDLMKK